MDRDARMYHALAKLSAAERVICVWTMAGFSNSEIADFQRCSVSEVEAVVSAARAKLRNALEGTDRRTPPADEP